MHSNNFFAIILLGIGLAGVCSAHQNETCDDPSTCACDPDGYGVTPIAGVDIDAIALKPWYVQEVYFRKPTAYVPLVCHSLSIGRLWYWTVVITTLGETYGLQGNGHNLYSVATLNDPEYPGATWDIHNAVTQNEYRTIITHTDDVGYGIMHFCPHRNNLGITHEHIYTFTSVPFPDAALMEQLREKVAGLGYPTEHAVQALHYASCPNATVARTEKFN